MDPDPYPPLLIGQLFLIAGAQTQIIWPIAGLLALIVISAFISGSEVAFFSLNPESIKQLTESKDRLSATVLDLIDAPRKLLATILIGNNLANISIVLLSTLITSRYLNLHENPLVEFLFNVVAITFVLLLFGEVLPKVYASRNPLEFARMMALPIDLLRRFFAPLSALLMGSTQWVEKRLKAKPTSISVEDLSTALEITEQGEEPHRDQKILKRIVNFGNTEVRQIMKPRMDVIALDINTPFPEVLKTILEHGYSRIPVYKENFDQIEGLLYIKDLLPHLEEEASFPWNTLLRPAFFIPENKKLDDLLSEFQSRKIHMSIVVDEYGGANGIATLEDVLEEILGEISDEFDDEDLTYSKLDARNYVFEGKILLRDFYRVLQIEGDAFEEVKGESDTLAGFVLEISGRIPTKNEVIHFDAYQMRIESVDKRRIKRIKVTYVGT